MEGGLIGEADLPGLTAGLVPRLRAGDVILLHGEIGAGKTTLVRHLVAALGGDTTQVRSPTFAIVHQYQARLPVVHVDAWRLASAAELEALGFHELADGALTCIEWPERVAGLVDPRRCWRIALEHADGGRRQVSIAPPSS